MEIEVTRRGEWPDKAEALVKVVLRPDRPAWDASRGFSAGTLTYHYRNGWHADRRLRRSLDVDSADGAGLREWRKALAAAAVRPCPPHNWIEYYVPTLGGLQRGGYGGHECEKCGARK